MTVMDVILMIKWLSQTVPDSVRYQKDRRKLPRVRMGTKGDFSEPGMERQEHGKDRSQDLVGGLPVLMETSVLGAPAGERSTSGGGELGWENPKALRAQRDHGGEEGRLWVLGEGPKASGLKLLGAEKSLGV